MTRLVKSQVISAVVRERDQDVATARLLQRMITVFGEPLDGIAHAYSGPNVDKLFEDVARDERVPPDGIAILRAEWLAGSARIAARGVLPGVPGDGPCLVLVFADFDADPGATVDGRVETALVTDHGIVRTERAN